MADFGDILSQWEGIQKSSNGKKTQAKGSGKKKNASFMDEEKIPLPTKEDSSQTMTAWLNMYGVVDKDAIVEKSQREKLLNNREYLYAMKPEKVIDLHGYTRDEAWNRLEAFVGDCYRRGIKKILIIHGKGNHSHGTNPVLGDMVKTFIEKDSRLGSSGHPDRNNGGSGATWVILKNPS